jgi:biopolymer transport protein ExbB/TolQ
MTPQQAQQLSHSHPPPLRAQELWAMPNRRYVMTVSVMASVVFIALATLLLGGRAAVLFLDYPSKHFVYPFTIQNMMHVVFFIGLGEVFVRWRTAERELSYIRAQYLPEDDQTVLEVRDLGPIRKRVAHQFDGDNGFLPSLINLAVLQFQSSRSIDQTAAVVNNSLELIAHRVDLRYGVVRFVAWLVPTMGFIGTVYGLGASLSEAGTSSTLDLKEVARTLAIGFDCTMVALGQSAILVFLLQLAQEKEETAVNLAGDYTLRNLINRLYAGGRP